MISYSPRLPFDWITVRVCLQGINQNSVLAAEKLLRIWGGGLTSQKIFKKTIHSFKFSSHTVLYFLCCRVWMLTCSLMHGRGHMLEALP